MLQLVNVKMEQTHTDPFFFFFSLFLHNSKKKITWGKSVRTKVNILAQALTNAACALNRYVNI